MTDETPEEVRDFIHYWGGIVDSVGVGKTNLSVVSEEEVKTDDLRNQLKRLKKKERVKREYRPCGEVYRKLSVDWDGKVSACCSDHDAQLTVGHIGQASLEEIWRNSAELKAIRTLLDNGCHRHLSRCSVCYHEYDHINVAPDDKKESAPETTVV